MAGASDPVVTDGPAPGTGPGAAEAHEHGAGEPAPAGAGPLEVLPPAEARTPGLRADEAWAEAGRKVLRFHLRRMLARMPGVIAGEDAEEVHAMRVAARRMRAAWRVFGDGFERDAVRRYRGELREIGARLGAVRDLDVLIGILVVHGEHRGQRQRAGIEPLVAAWRAERESRRVGLIELLASEGFGTFVADYEELVETPGLAAVTIAPNAPGLVRNRMPATIWDAYQAVWAFDEGLETADLATLHELRIAAKWLRYTLEFVREPIEPQAAGLIRPVVALQDRLGDQHDRHVAAMLALDFAAGPAVTGPVQKAVGRFVDDLDRRVDRLGRGLGATWRPIVAPAYRRDLGRAIARL